MTVISGNKASNLKQIAKGNKFKVYTQKQLNKIPQIQALPDETQLDMQIVSSILPFRVNQYVIDQLIDWNNIPGDPIYQLTFPQRGMLSDDHYDQMAKKIKSGATKAEIDALANSIRKELNPHPAGQQQANVPMLKGEPIPGMQHKYRETVLFFPAQGQTCHSYCTFCFRWAQFIGDKELRFASREAEQLHHYLDEHKEVSDLLITGGDPMVMKAHHLREYVQPLIDGKLEHVQTVRIGSKALSFWPYRFLTDDDANEMLAIFEDLVKAGKHVAFMAHFNHWREMQTDAVEFAIKRIQSTGAVVRSQSPVIGHINDNAEDWAKLWRTQVKHGIVPYYMFIERDTGAKCYFEIPLAKTYEIYRDAIQQVSGLARTARGPSMSANPGKVEIQGVTTIAGEKVFVLRFIQARNPEWVQQPFFAKYDEKATWLDDLKPAFGKNRFFFEN
jgi:KamA family protein